MQLQVSTQLVLLGKPNCLLYWHFHGLPCSGAVENTGVAGFLTLVVLVVGLSGDV